MACQREKIRLHRAWTGGVMTSRRDDADDDARTRTPANWLDDLLTPQPVRLSISLRQLLVSQFSASDLRHLASLMDAGSPGMVARRNLSNASLEELAEMLTRSRKPTLGWWTRHTDVAA
jgi:hypothetical protein